jgi:pilus assembly protein Flp/PilA
LFDLWDWLYGESFASLLRMTLMSMLKNFLRDESGATAIEYGLIAALVSVAAITALGAMGNSLITIFNRVASELNAAAG